MRKGKSALSHREVLERNRMGSAKFGVLHSLRSAETWLRDAKQGAKSRGSRFLGGAGSGFDLQKHRAVYSTLQRVVRGAKAAISAKATSGRLAWGKRLANSAFSALDYVEQYNRLPPRMVGGPVRVKATVRKGKRVKAHTRKAGKRRLHPANRPVTKNRRRR